MEITTPLSPSSHLRVSTVSKSFADKRVLTNISFTVPFGARVGLIGENGSGKSTLLRIVAGDIQPDAGEVTLPSNVRIRLLSQVFPFDDKQTVREAVEDSVKSARLAVRQVSELGEAIATQADDQKIAEAFARALDTAERLGAWDVDARIGQILSGLGLGNITLERQTGSLSGGQRARLALAWTLLSNPDILLLDEPTNHMDDGARSFLTDILRGWSGIVLFASHDRAFLDETATSLIDLDPMPLPHKLSQAFTKDSDGAGIGATHFGGTYGQYLLAREDTRDRWEKQYRDEQAEIAALKAQAKDSHTHGHQNRDFKVEVKATKKFYSDRNSKVISRRVNDFETKLLRLEEEQIRKPPRLLRFRGYETTKSGAVSPGFAVRVENASFKDRLSSTTLAVPFGERLLITGANGSGKSTLLKMIAGKLTPTSGNISLATGVTIGLLDQELDLPDPKRRGGNRTVLEAYQDLAGLDAPPLGHFGLISGRDFNRPLRLLSTGQQRRIQLAVLLAKEPNILLLDEPTNHLSLVLATELENALPNYPGTVIMASHDKWLRSLWNGKVFQLP